MEAKELMIGDWVINKDEPTKVNYLNDVKIGTENEYFIEYCECDPIPLTEEILKANGFLNLHSDFQRKHNIWMEDTHAFIEYNFAQENNNFNRLIIALDGAFVINLPLLYVHELQHALRLCGLNDVADNFKIEYAKEK